MSGHSKWAQIKRKKQATDAKRGQLFTKLIREITVAARAEGGDLDGNPRLRTAITAAKGANMPLENIERAIKKGTGELPGVVYEEVSYEGYGPGGVAILVEALTDNKNRTTSDIRHIFSNHGGSLGNTGCVVWIFQQKGIVTVSQSGCDEEALMAIVLEAGAEDLQSDNGSFEILSPLNALEDIKKALEENGISYANAEITRNPQTSVKIEGRQAQQVLKLVESLEEQEDVQKVYANFDIPEEMMVGIVE
ncbi:YebC/PmpR family DNA-binding transcriptional regulator [candidate division TA06 bacterium]|nr:YebC/PmpR family DNA-binding transcriptional regulator [candidate division TA06 bacterium]